MNPLKNITTSLKQCQERFKGTVWFKFPRFGLSQLTNNLTLSIIQIYGYQPRPKNINKLFSLFNLFPSILNIVSNNIYVHKQRIQMNR